MPKTRPGLGIGSLPNGRENYKACLLFHTSTDISPEDVHKKGLSEVARIEKVVRQVYTMMIPSFLYIYFDISTNRSAFTY